MYLNILFLPFFTTCLGMLSPINNFMEKKGFICKSEPDQQVMKKEEDISPRSDIGVRSFLLDRSMHWPHGVVPYELDPTFSVEQVQRIHQVIAKFNSISCVQWVERDYQPDYVSFEHVSEPGQCASAVGRHPGEQTLELGDDCFSVEKGYGGAIIHEMMHAVGFIHEQQRIDRDCYVNVASSINETRAHDYSLTEGTSTEFPYDLGSIMHYGKTEYLSSKTGEKFGNPQGELTEMDIMKLKYMYCGGKSFCEERPGECRRYHEVQKQCRIH